MRTLSCRNILPFIGILVLLLNAPLSVSAGKKRDGSGYTMSELRRPETTAALLQKAEAMRADYESELERAKAEDDEDLEDDLKDNLDMLEFAEEWLSDTVGAGSTGKEVFSVNSQVSRILYGLEEPVPEGKLPPLPALFRNVFIGKYVGHPIPDVAATRRDDPIGARQAAREAVYLYVEGRDSFISPEDLAAMTPEQIAALDVSPEHPAWYDRESFARLQPDPVGHFQNFIREGNTDELWDDDVIDKGESYDPERARMVLFLDEIYEAGTSPKGTAEDEFGAEWKVKWADEVAIEPVVNRLYLLAGGKMTDLVYTSGSGPEDMILVLRKEPKDDPKEDERYPTTVEELKSGLMDLYQFDLRPYIHSHGVITEDNASYLLRHLTGRGDKDYRRNEVIGRQWVAFRESSVEQQTKGFVQRLSGSRLNDVVARNDRAARGSFIFDMWIANRDAKEDNNKAFFIREPDDGDMEIAEYREGHHDMGLSLGSLMASGEVNRFSTGRDFARRGAFGKLRFRQAVLFYPAAWDAATWADGRWMAQRIAAISEPQIRQAVDASGWPDFAREVLAWRLIDRRNRISQLFGVTAELGNIRSVAPTWSIPLGTPEQIRAAELHYGLPEGSLQAELAAAGKGPGYVETVVRDGVITSCRNSALIRVLTRYRYPSGLDTRYERQNKKSPRCLNP